jgi:guanine deaminase
MSELDERFLRRVIELALDNVAAGDQPFGALVVVDGSVVGEGVNRVLCEGDPTDHAEVAAIRAACRTLGVLELTDATLYSSAQPCPMCQGAARLVGIRRTLYAARVEVVARAGFSLPEVAEGATFEHVEIDGAGEPFEHWLQGGSA